MSTWHRIDGGEIVETRNRPPRSGLDRQGRTVSFKRNPGPRDLRPYGWVVAVEPDEIPDVDPRTQTLVRTVALVDSDVIASYDVVGNGRVRLLVDHYTIFADGTDEISVTYLDGRDDAPAEVEFSANGATETVPLVAGVAETSVTADTAGPVEIRVDVEPSLYVLCEAVAP